MDRHQWDAQMDPYLCELGFKLRRMGLIEDDGEVALLAVKAAANIIENSQGKTIQELITALQNASAFLQEAAPHELVIGSVFSQSLNKVRLIGSGNSFLPQTRPLFDRLLWIGNDSRTEVPLTNQNLDDLKRGMREMAAAIRQGDEDAMCNIAGDFIGRPNESVLLAGYCPLAIHFVIAAYESVTDELRKGFMVYVTENLPSRDGEKAKAELEAAKITAVVVPDAVVSTLISRCSRVLLAPRAVLINGGLLTRAGGSLVAQAASHIQVPVHVIVRRSAITTHPPSDSREMAAFSAPQVIAPAAQATLDGTLQVVNPLLDYVEPRYVTTFWCYEGCIAPPFLPRIIQTLHHFQDY